MVVMADYSADYSEDYSDYSNDSNDYTNDSDDSNNDSLVVLANYDYREGETGATYEEDTVKDEVTEDVEDEDHVENSVLDEEIINDKDLESVGLEQGSFEKTLRGMMEALVDIRTKGDLMMGAIR